MIVGAAHPPDVVQAFPVRERLGRQHRSSGRFFPRCTVHRSSFSPYIPFFLSFFLPVLDVGPYIGSYFGSYVG